LQKLLFPNYSLATIATISWCEIIYFPPANILLSMTNNCFDKLSFHHRFTVWMSAPPTDDVGYFSSSGRFAFLFLVHLTVITCAMLPVNTRSILSIALKKYFVVCLFQILLFLSKGGFPDPTPKINVSFIF